MNQRMGLAIGFLVLVAGCNSDPAPVTVTFSSITLRPPVAILTVGQTRRFLCQLNGDRGEAFNVTSTAEWDSSDRAVLGTSGDGLVTGAAPGAGTVRASREGVRGEAKVKVVPSAIATLAITPGPVMLDPNGSVQLTATATLAGGTTEEVTGYVAWSSDNPAVATVAAGRVQAVGPGQAHIRATADLVAADPVTIDVRP